jgi:hypothetical protein
VHDGMASTRQLADMQRRVEALEVLAHELQRGTSERAADARVDALERGVQELKVSCGVTAGLFTCVELCRPIHCIGLKSDGPCIGLPRRRRCRLNSSAPQLDWTPWMSKQGDLF